MTEGFYEGVLRWFGHVERMEKDRTAKRIYIRKCTGSHSVAMWQKSCTDTVKIFLKKGFDDREASRIAGDL